MRILFYIVFNIGIICDPIFYQLNAFGVKQEKRSTPIEISKLQNLLAKNSIPEYRKEINRETRHAISRRTESGLKKNGANRFLKGKRNLEDISPPFYVINHPEHVGDGARLRFDFAHPNGNGSCPNFRGTAEVVAGQWRLPPADMPVVLNSGKDFSHDLIGPDFIPGDETHEVTSVAVATTRKKGPGFFKGVENFFRHSFHMDKTTTPIETTTKKIITNPQDVNFIKRPFLRLQNSESQDREEFGKGKATPFMKSKLSSAGRDATFNLRIKAVAIPRLQGTRRAGS